MWYVSLLAVMEASMRSDQRTCVLVCSAGRHERMTMPKLRFQVQHESVNSCMHQYCELRDAAQ